ncbi:MAG: Hsp20/alpha crystallin family protein [Candidatus Obscuribacterales bacterium]|nr:Hsp20/alpha crystallin family protein [Candidatus Obscuribacterales bacterium]
MSTALTERDQKELQVELEAENTRPRKTYIPRTDIYESAEKIVLKADMPGVDENNVDITVENNILTISACPEIRNKEGFSQALCEYGVGDFRRVFTLSNAIDKEGIEAVCKNGVLTLTLPKSKALLPKKITVKSE